MDYASGENELKNWIIAETGFNPEYLGKCEAIMALGNGYLGLRSATEESYVGEVRNLFVAGTFNRFDEYEVTELPNGADITRMDIRINGKRFSLENGNIKAYKRMLNLKTGELTRHIRWVSPRGEELEFTFRRFVSLNNLHCIGMRAEITAMNQDMEVSIESGINGQLTNTGVQHFHEGEKRIFEKKYLQLIQTTTQSKIDFVVNTVHQYRVDGKEVDREPKMVIDRRKVVLIQDIKLNRGQKLVVEKISNVYTSRDKEYDHGDYSLEVLRKDALFNLKSECKKGYEGLLQESVKKWEEVWEKYSIRIDSLQDFDQLAIRFAHYHLVIMTPAHDNRMGIGAKGLSGEGYKGHSFWDTEIYILPFFTYTDPKIARKLLEYRYHTIEGARKKAKENGYEGAMYPWESAWKDDGEVTPVWGAVDIVTGEATKIWSGFIEKHISSDIAFALWQYYMITGDKDFMENYGYEMLFEIAKFWASCLEWNEEKKEYHINDVIGPDEYKEHVNNNAFTNYMARWTISTAIDYYHVVKEKKPEVYGRLNAPLGLDEAYRHWISKVDKIYLPQPRQEDLVIPQDDTYLQKEIIDLTKYKNQKHVGSIFRDYNLEQVNNIQVSKQADTLILFYLLENLFTKDIKRANWNYYEPKTLHDSSLSLSIHSILACDMDDLELAYSLFERAARIDLGPNMKSSDHGIHAAALGGIWQAVVCGFGGVRMLNGELRIDPKLPKEWSRLEFPIGWRGNRLYIAVTKEKNQQRLHITRMSNRGNAEAITLEVRGRKYTFKERLMINL